MRRFLSLRQSVPPVSVSSGSARAVRTKLGAELRLRPLPESWHHMAISHSLDQRGSRARRLLWLFSVAALLFVQIVSLFAISRALGDSVMRACEVDTDCPPAAYCVPPSATLLDYDNTTVIADLEIERPITAPRTKGTCYPCAFPARMCNEGEVARAPVYANASAYINALPEAPTLGLIRQAETAGGQVFYLRDEWAVALSPKERIRFCSGCKTIAGSVRSWATVANESVRSMLWYDWLTLLLCSLMAGAMVKREAEDVRLAQVRLMHWALKDIAQNTDDEKQPGDGWFSERNFWRICMFVIQLVRFFAFLPLLISTFPLFVLGQGSNSVSICLNTIAILFILELDDFLVQGFLFGAAAAEENQMPLILNWRSNQYLEVAGLVSAITPIVAIFTPLLVVHQHKLLVYPVLMVSNHVFTIWFIGSAIVDVFIAPWLRMGMTARALRVGLASLVVWLTSWVVTATLFTAMFDVVGGFFEEAGRGGVAALEMAGGAYLKPFGTFSSVSTDLLPQDPWDPFWFLDAFAIEGLEYALDSPPLALGALGQIFPPP